MLMTRQSIPYPVLPGDWVANRLNAGCVAKVQDVVFDRRDGFLVDLILFTVEGDRIGRTNSPTKGNQRYFEPCCPYTDWQRISDPQFPMPVKMTRDSAGELRAEWLHGAVTLADRH
jgi:hypothetical protein